MTKIIFMLWLLSGKVQVQKDNFGYTDYNDGRILYKVQVSPTIIRTNAYKGEILNFIRTGSWQDNEDFSDTNGRIAEDKQPVDTICYRGTQGDTKLYYVYGEGKKRYVIDEYLKCKIYIKK